MIWISDGVFFRFNAPYNKAHNLLDYVTIQPKLAKEASV